MYRCLQLAQLGRSSVAPNPMVGAVLVCNDTVIGEGYHQQYGGPHAEVNCINSVLDKDKHLISQSTLYVSLEPCNHFGKTPPCSDLIIQHNIPNVVIACQDSFEAVNGSGIKKLQDAGVNVVVGVLEKEALALNKCFFTFHRQKRPYIILKWAQSNDLKIANQDYSSLKISNDATNVLVHQWRSEEASILVGTNTAKYDNPSLTTRLVDGKNPVRLVIDIDLKLPSTLHLFDAKVKTIVFNKIKQSTENEHLQYCQIDEKENILPQILNALYDLNINSMLVEGGAKLLQSFIESNLWDEARVITNEQLNIDEGIAGPVLRKEVKESSYNILSDKIDIYHPIS